MLLSGNKYYDSAVIRQEQIKQERPRLGRLKQRSDAGQKHKKYDNSKRLMFAEFLQQQEQ